MPKRNDAKAGLIEKTVLIQASPSVIFRALTGGKELTEWFCDRATSHPEVGGELQAYWRAGKSGQSGKAIFTQIVPESLIELRWVDEGKGVLEVDKARHVLSYKIRSRRGTSEVLMRDEDALPSDDETMAVLSEGWNSVLLELKDYCERKERSLKRRAIRSQEGSE